MTRSKKIGSRYIEYCSRCKATLYRWEKKDREREAAFLSHKSIKKEKRSTPIEERVETIVAGDVSL
jgi:hypothetical protein